MIPVWRISEAVEMIEKCLVQSPQVKLLSREFIFFLDPIFKSGKGLGSLENVQ